MSRPFANWPERSALRGTQRRATRLLTRPLAPLGEELTVEQVELPIAGLHPAMEGYRLVQLSDMHLYPFTRLAFIAQAVEAANALKPDLICVTGDYVSNAAESIYDLEPVVGRLNARDGVYATLGNHDHWSSAKTVRAGLRRAGLTVLHNQSVPLGDGRLWLVGLDDGWVGRADLQHALDQAPGKNPVVLMMHEPDLIDEYAQNPRIALQLSGHTHGGQVRLMNPRRAYTLPFLGRKYDQGLYRVNNAWLYTNRGIGTVIAPIRVNCPAEVTEITLVAGPPAAEADLHPAQADG